MKLRCYCCGEAIEGDIVLIANGVDSVDRVFVALPEHVERFDEQAQSMVVIRRWPADESKTG